MSSALCCSDLTWPSLLSRASASSRRLAGTRRTNEAVERPSPVAICEDCTKPPAAWVARTTPSPAFWTSVVVSSRRVLRSTRRSRAGADGVARVEPPLLPPALLPLLLLAESEASGAIRPLWFTTASPLPPLLALSFEPPPAASTTATIAAIAQPPTPSAGISGRSAKRLRGSGRSKPRSTRRSRCARNAGSIVGASARTSRTREASSGSAAEWPARAASSASSSAATAGSRVDSRRRMTGLSQSGEGAVHAGARVGGRHAEDVGDLGVVQARVELQGDELALAWLQGGQRGAHGGAALGGLGLAVRRGLVAGGLG